MTSTELAALRREVAQLRAEARRNRLYRHQQPAAWLRLLRRQGR
jgi:hypothetical protein